MLILLLGPKGSGKSHIGTLLEKRLEVRFVRVEDHWLEYHARCRAASREPDLAEGIARIHPLIRAALGRHDRVCVETTGASALILDALLSLERPCHTLTVRVEASLPLCLERIAGRDAGRQIPLDEAAIRRVDGLSRALVLPADQTIVNVDLDDDPLVTLFAGALDAKQKALCSLPPPRDETAAERIRRLVAEPVTIVPYDPTWPALFEKERDHLRSCLPQRLIGRIEHFGSTAVPGMAAKPIVDMLVEVAGRQEARDEIAPALEAQGYDGLWRPTHGNDGPPFYPWLIRRDPESGARTHHLHMVEPGDDSHWSRLLFRDHLRCHREAAREYAALKQRLASATAADRVSYTRGKTAFVERVTGEARRPSDQGR